MLLLTDVLLKITVFSVGGDIQHRFVKGSPASKAGGELTQSYAILAFSRTYQKRGVCSETRIKSSFGVPHALSSRARREIPSQSIR